MSKNIRMWDKCKFLRRILMTEINSNEKEIFSELNADGKEEYSWMR
jgi:hypothetical protein